MRRQILLAGGFLAAALLVTPLATGSFAVARPAAQGTSSGDAARAGAALARRHCVTCHPFSAPETLPRSSWKGTIEKMSLIVAGKDVPGWDTPRTPIVLSPDYAAILAYYEANAPVALPSPDPWPAADGRPVPFVRRSIAFKDALTPEPAVSNVQLADLDGDQRPELLGADMRQGLVLLARPDDAKAGSIPLAQAPHPAHVTVVDLDKDGRKDLVLADLGAFFPGDHNNGAVAILRGRAGGGFAPFNLGGFPRVADVQPGDFDGDGRLDLVVAAFGWFRTGEITLLLNRTEDWEKPVFERKVIDARAGAVHVVPADLDGDGKLDFVVLLAQHYESVLAFLGDGKGGFRSRTLYAAPHPNWGSSGIQLTDLDGDGDLDILATNGDMFDDDILKPYHGIQWLENRGKLRFDPHPLATLPGAHRAVAGDVDGDGDQDVVASAFTGAATTASGRPQAAIVWLEQGPRGRFTRHTIAAGRPLYATADVGDVDGDGDLDVVTGLLTLGSSFDHWLEVWENQRISPEVR
jgi:mono/diheme cytochrome c family protein